MDRDLRSAAEAALAAMQDVIEAAYYRCYPECCGRAGMECCNQPLQTWSPDDQHIMDTLGPAKKNLRAALDADADRVSVPSGLHYDLDGVIVDVERGHGFDAVCLSTIKRVRDVLAAHEKEPQL